MNLSTSGFAAASGLLLAASFPVLDLWFLAWIALIPLLFALRGQSVRNGFLLGGITGLVFFAGTVHWVTNSIHYYGNIPLLPASLITLLLCAYLALYPALFGAAVARLERERPSLLFFAAPAVWTALELARTYVFSGFPWALLGYSQHAVLPVIQIADITGVYGVSFLIVVVNAAAARFLQGHNRRAAILTVFLAVGLALAYGFFRLSSTPSDHDSITVSVIQGNIEQDKKWDPAYQSQTIAAYKRLTLDALKEKPDLIVWPETATPFYFTGNRAAERRMTEDLKDFAAAAGVPLLFGSPTYEVRKPGDVVLRNSAFLLSGSGQISARYDKFHLVPFGEYVPLKSMLFFVEKMVQAVGDFAAGQEFTIMAVRNGAVDPKDVKVSTVICYEIIFPDLVRRFVDRGAGVITTITNDAWFGRTAAPYQHFSMAVFRAVENRVPVARSANTGISGFVDATGAVLGATGIFTEAQLTRAITPGSAGTLYTRFGDVFSYACCLFSVLVLLNVPIKNLLRK